jgi:hypothetical protein
MLETWGRHYWPIFLIISSVWILTGFGIPETIALVTKVSTHADNTLSYYARSDLNVSLQTTKHTVAWYLSFITWVFFSIWITAHIWFDQFG